MQQRLFFICLKDFGQKLGQLTACDGCGMTYSEQEPSDIVLHTKFHKNIFNTLKFPVQTVRNIVDAELGFASEHRRIVPGEQTFLYISGDQQVVGCCVAQIVTKGYRVISDGQTGDGQSATSKPWCCSTNAEPVKCGISRIWVLASERGQKIGSKLIDCVRYHFILGYPLKKADLAFSDPTPDGRSFATRYMGTSSFLVYRAFRSPSLEQ
ncbi:hypothetical protein LSH36_251g06001 [Paralvinella palmiformis]|uniref:Uncharacterized protein n=1 Tax=Paralvinella palmiformis TaxID=53620 RepID=A0AAD9N2S3_9ANNE|nr:hypothetical protein LSH36_251g06001 [Paralvinella palmiformis]